MSKNIYEVLIAEHEEAKKILDKLSKSSANDAKDVEQRRKMGHKVVVELISHNEAESQVLYQRLMEFDDLRSHVEEHQDEHKEANKELKALLNINVEDAKWLEKLRDIKKAVEHHVEDEENKLFPEAKKVLDEAEAKSLAEKFKELQDQRKNLMQPA